MKVYIDELCIKWYKSYKEDDKEGDVHIRGEAEDGIALLIDRYTDS